MNVATKNDSRLGTCSRACMGLILVLLACAQSSADDKPVTSGNPLPDKKARFFETQRNLIAGLPSEELKQRNQEAKSERAGARSARDLVRHNKSAVHVTAQEKARQERQATLRECRAEAAQIALEEAALNKLLADEPSMADLVESQRNEIVMRKRMLILIESSAKDLAPADAAKAIAGDRKKKK